MPVLRTNSVDTYYEVHGEGTPLVLIHGIGACQRLWRLQIEPFSKHMKVVAYDVRGHGKSSGSDERYSIKLFASDLKALLDQLDIKKAHLCGLSMGGLIAQQFALDHPQAVDRLILAGTFCHLGLTGNLMIGFYKTLNRLVLYFIGMDRYAEMGAKGLFRKKEQEELRRFYLEEVASISKKEFLKAIDATYAFDSLCMLRHIESPTLILNAEGEKRERQQTELMCREIKDCKKEVITDAFHASNLEKPEEFNRLVLDFLS
ncbi:MAG: alpha/beta hydrolase [Chloroflexota bacterium]|nr:alpha/beta hydrolase [Chloroflexota bacterium]